MPLGKAWIYNFFHQLWANGRQNVLSMLSRSTSQGEENLQFMLPTNTSWASMEELMLIIPYVLQFLVKTWGLHWTVN